MSAVVTQSKPKLASFLNLLLVIILGVLASKLMWMVVSPEKTTNYQKKSESVLQPNQQRKVVNYGKIIAEQHIFGELKKVAVVKVPVSEVAKKAVIVTKLNLKLHGIVAYQSKEGFALISSSGGKQKVYKKGETIQEGVLVSKIFPEKVVLDNHGKPEELLLPVKEVSVETKTSRAPRPRDLLKHRSSLMPPTQNLRDHGNANIAELRDEIRANPMVLMEIVRPSPAIVDGQFIGYRIQPGKQRRRFRELGFRPNDIIIEVNGILLDDASKGAMIISELEQASSVSVRVKRGQQEIMIEESF